MIRTRYTKIYQIKEGYCYNSDSLFLWDFALLNIKKSSKVLEIGSGSGIIGILCAREKEINLYQIEKQKEYAILNAKNTQINNIKSNIIHANCNDVFNSKDLLMQFNNICIKDPDNNEDSQTKNAKINSMQYFDTIISNPPFYARKTLPSSNIFKEQATQSHNLPLKTILIGAKKILKPQAKLIFCYTPYMLSNIIYILREFNFSLDSIRFVYPRVDKNATLVLICAKKNGNTQTITLPPLITHNGKMQQNNTEEVKSIYERAKTHSIKISQSDIIWDQLMNLRIHTI